MPSRKVLALSLALFAPQSEAILRSGGGSKSHSNAAADAMQASEADLAANPIRKVVNMMKKMADKVAEEGEKEESSFKKFECYCKTTMKELQEQIAAAEGSTVTQSDIDAAESELAKLQDEMKVLKGDRSTAEESLASANSQREKDEMTFKKETDEEKQVAAATKNAADIMGGGSFLQTSNALPKLREILAPMQRSDTVDDLAKEQILAFLQGKHQEDPGGVKSMLKQMSAEASKKVIDLKDNEEKAIQAFKGLRQSKDEEIRAIIKMVEKKMSRIGELQVNIVNMKNEMQNSGRVLEENKKMLGEMEKDCKSKAVQFEERKSVRAEEQVALKETIEMLNKDDSLELFKKTIPGPALLQLNAEARSKRLSLAKILRSSTRPEMSFIAMALSGQKVDMTKVLKMIDDMLALLKKEGQADADKKDYCNAEFAKSEASIKEFKGAIANSEATIASSKESIAKLAEGIEALKNGIAELDKGVAQAGELRKDEHAEFEETTSSSATALKLLGMAKTRLAKFYGSFLQKQEESFLQISQEPEAEAKAPPSPGFEGSYQKGNSAGVVGMLTTLEGELKKEMAVAKTDEASAQKEYEDTVKDAAEKRESDLSDVEAKTRSKADLEEDLSTATQEKDATGKRLLASEKFDYDLHKDCDWSLKNFDLRKEARSQEMDSLTTAKATLATLSF